MSRQENIDQFRRLIEVGFNDADLSVVDEIVGPDCVEHQRGLKPGPDGVKETIQTLHRWFADFELSIEDLVAEGDMVWSRNRARGVSNGSVMGRPSMGTPIEIDVIDIARFEHGRMVEHWGVPDQLGVMLQLGLIPRPQAAPAA